MKEDIKSCQGCTFYFSGLCDFPRQLEKLESMEGLVNYTKRHLNKNIPCKYFIYSPNDER